MKVIWTNVLLQFAFLQSELQDCYMSIYFLDYMTTQKQLSVCVCVCVCVWARRDSR